MGPIDGHNLGARRGTPERPRDLQRVPRRRPRPDAQGARVRAGRGEPEQAHQPGTPAAAAGPGAPIQLLSGLRPNADRQDRAGREDRRHQRRDARRNGAGRGQAALSGQGVRRRDRRRARGHGRDDGEGRMEAGRRDLLDLLHAPSISSSTTWVYSPCRSRSASTARGSSATTARPTGELDITYTRCVPNLTVAAPRDENELQRLLFTALESDRPFAIRYPRGLGSASSSNPPSDRSRSDEERFFERGRGPVPAGLRVAMVSVALAAAEELASRGVSCGVADARFVKPLDLPPLRRLAEGVRPDPDPRGTPGGRRVRKRHLRGLPRGVASDGRPQAPRDPGSVHRAQPAGGPAFQPEARRRRGDPTGARALPELAGTDPKEGRGGSRRREEKLAETVTW